MSVNIACTLAGNFIIVFSRHFIIIWFARHVQTRKPAVAEIADRTDIFVVLRTV